MIRVLCLRNGNQETAAASHAVAQAVLSLKLSDLEVLESDAANFHPLDAVVGCDRLAIVDDAAHATPHYQLISEAFSAATDMNLGVPTEIVILAIDTVQALEGIVNRIREFAAIPSGNRRDNSLCRTDACDVCIGENACIDKLLVRPASVR